MIYEKTLIPVLQDERAELNGKIIESIAAGDGRYTPQYVYNHYTGLGGLHGLRREDYPDYHSYSQAKKEVEMGQFFTPHDVCEQMVQIAAPGEKDTVLEMCCGMGNFFNQLPYPENVCGFDIDPKAVSVARYLYPEARIEQRDICKFKPPQLYDMVIGNPPFNLKFKNTHSQVFYINKAAEALKPGGFLVMIVPGSFMEDEFWEKRRVKAVNRNFSFVGQTFLDKNAFAAVGVEDFQTKIMVFMRRSDYLEHAEYDPDIILTTDQLQYEVTFLREEKQRNRLKLLRESRQMEASETQKQEYKLRKYLYEIKSHPHIREKHYEKAVALVEKFRNQQSPLNATRDEMEEWERDKLTLPKILPILKRYITRQYVVHRKEIALVRTSYGFKLKAYAPGLIPADMDTYTSLVDLVTNSKPLPPMPELTFKQEKQYAAAQKTIRRKRREYELQSQPFEQMKRNRALDRYLSRLSFFNLRGERCRFIDKQQHDMGLLYQKRYSLLNWQQGSGKTAVAYHFGKYTMRRDKVKNTVILAPALAVTLTWIPFLKANGERYRWVNSWKDFEDIPEGVFVIVSISMLAQLKRYIKRFVKSRSNKICLLFDESDEITNPASQRTKNTLDLFRRCAYKMLATGTTTRNNITELYSQIELMYNNSVNMISNSKWVYFMDREGTLNKTWNVYLGKPFPAHGGARLFRASFCPVKASVFGIEKLNQDVYNKDELNKLIAKTIITRKFKDFAGDKYKIKTLNVEPSKAEMRVYEVIYDEFARICYEFYTSTGNDRKEAQLRLIRQIQLLIKACSMPTSFADYHGDPYPAKTACIASVINNTSDKVLVGCTTLEALDMYEEFIRERFPHRPLFRVDGEVSFNKRKKILAEFEATGSGILVATQQSLKSSVNVPSCNNVILESMQWNIPKMEQFYFRCIRLDSDDITQVYYVNYKDSIEQNLMALVLKKEQLNDFIKNGEVTDDAAIFDEFDISPSFIEQVIRREQDKEGRFRLVWGEQKVA